MANENGEWRIANGEWKKTATGGERLRDDKRCPYRGGSGQP
jgi:hypothetical protein